MYAGFLGPTKGGEDKNLYVRLKYDHHESYIDRTILENAWYKNVNIILCIQCF